MEQQSSTSTLPESLTRQPWNLEAWLDAIKQSRISNSWSSGAEEGGAPPSAQHPLTERLLEEAVGRFPTVAKVWIAYIDWESNNKRWDRVEELFSRCVQQAHGTSIELWRVYLAYVRSTQGRKGGAGAGSLTIGTSAEGNPDNDVVIQAYNVALQAVGLDRDAGSIWTDYISYVSTLPAQSSFDEQQRLDRVRKIYHQCICIPLMNLETIWRDYDKWENQRDRLMAKKLLGDHSPSYMTARSALGILKNIMEQVDQFTHDYVPRPPSWTSERELAHILAWKRWIIWERSNPLHLKDKNALNSRVLYAFKKCISVLRFYPEVYYDYASYLKELGMLEECKDVLEQGQSVMPSSLLLTFALSEVHESKGSDFSSSIAPLFDTLLAKLFASLIDIRAQYTTEREALLAELKAKDAVDTVPESEWDGERREKEREKQKERELMVAQVLDLKMAKQEHPVKQSLSLTWITYMRCALRSASIKTARSIFGRARKSEYCSYHVFVASALMEYHCNRDPTVAGKIFEVGLKAVDLATDRDAPAYILEYLKFLISLNDENNARALFERALSSIPADRARTLWAFYVEFETKYGDTGSVDKVMKRQAIAYPDDVRTVTGIQMLASKYSFLDLTVIGDLELGLSAAAVVSQMPSSQIFRASSEKSPGKAIVPPVYTPGRHKNMESVNPEAYPRPDLTKWSQYRPDPAAVEAAKANVATALQEDSDRPRTAPGSPSMISGQVRPGIGILGGPPPPPDHVPEAIMHYLQSLGPPHLYNGPVIGAAEFMEILRVANVPLPPVPPRYVPYNLNALWGMQPTGPAFTGYQRMPPGGGPPFAPQPMDMGQRPGILKRERDDGGGGGRPWQQQQQPQQGQPSSYRVLPEKRFRA